MACKKTIFKACGTSSSSNRSLTCQDATAHRRRRGTGLPGDAPVERVVGDRGGLQKAAAVQELQREPEGVLRQRHGVALHKNLQFSTLEVELPPAVCPSGQCATAELIEQRLCREFLTSLATIQAAALRW